MKTLTSLLALVALAASASSAHAQSGTMWKLHAHNTAAQTSSNFGAAAAMNETWIVIGEPGNDDAQTNSGAVHVYQAATGLFLRKLPNPTPAMNARFGQAVAVSGDQAVIGAPGAAGNGAAYVVDLKTGKLIATLNAPALGSAHFGGSVAMLGKRIVVGDRDGTSAAGSTGLVHVYADLLPGTLPTTLVPADALSGDEWGASLSLCGDLLLAGTPRQDGAKGAAYLFDATTGTQLRKWTGSSPSEKAGSSVALAGGIAYIGAPFGSGGGATEGGRVDCYSLVTGLNIGSTITQSNSFSHSGTSVSAWGPHVVAGAPGAFKGNSQSAGVAESFSAPNTPPSRRIFAPDCGTADALGTVVCVWGNRILATAPGDDDLGADAGAAYLVPIVPMGMQLPALAATQSLAPGLIDARHTLLGDGYASAGSRAIFTSSVADPGFIGGKGIAVFTTAKTFFTPALSLATGQDLAAMGLPGVKAIGFSQFNTRYNSALTFHAKLAGPGINATNDILLLADDGASVFPLFRKGSAVPLLNGAVVDQWSTVTESFGIGPILLAQLKPGIAGVTTTNDSALLTLSTTGTVTGALREGSMSPAGVPFGPILRVDSNAAGDTMILAALQAPTNNLAVFSVNLATMTPTLIARKGDAAPGITGGNFSSFIGETHAGAQPFIRATVTGAGINGTNNEGIWTKTAQLTLVARTGNQVDGMSTGVRWVRFLGCWPTKNNSTLVLGTVVGTGVTATNNTVLWFSPNNGLPQVLLRTGDSLEGTDPFKLSIIQRIAFDMGAGTYTVLAALSGAPADRNQVLLIGSTDSVAPALAILRRPSLRMQKGCYYDRQQGGITRLSTMNWSAPVIEPIGLAGQPSISATDRRVMRLGYTNGITEMVWGTP